MLLRIVGSVEVLRVVRTELMLPRGHAWTLCCRVFLCVKMRIYCRMLMIIVWGIGFLHGVVNKDVKGKIAKLKL